MIKEKITYTDYDGDVRVEDFYFNFTKAELIEMDYTTKGGFRQACQEVLESNDRVEIFNMFKWLILKAVGKKSEDGRRFVKSEEISKEFEECPAYTELLLKLLGDSDYCVNFISATLPNDLNVANTPVLSEA